MGEKLFQRQQNVKETIVMNFGMTVDFLEDVYEIYNFNLQLFLDYNNFYQKKIKYMDSSSGVGVTLCLGIGLALCFYLPFIICDLYFAYNDSSPCLTQDLNAVSFTLKTWLEVDAYVKIVSLVLIIILLLLMIAKANAAAAFAGCFVIYACLGALFSLAWFIVGAIIFWGQLNPNGTCHHSLNAYMWTVLILNAFSIFCQLATTRQQRS